MDLSSSSYTSSTLNQSRHTTTAVSLRTSMSSSSAQTLYYYNVDAILSELIRPATPKHGNLARPRLVKPEPIRPQQLVGATGMNYHHHHGSGSGHSRNDSEKTTTPVPVLNDRMEGARNPDPFQQELTSPFYMDDNEEEYDHVGMTYGSDIPMTVDCYGHNPNIGTGSSKRSRDDEDILYYKKGSKSTTSEEIDAATSAALVTPNPIQYYTTTTTNINISGSSVTGTSPAMLTFHDPPQYILYKNYNDSNVNQDENKNLLWTTTPSVTVSCSIVKPIAMRPMDVILHLQDHYHRMDDSVVTVLPSPISSCPPPSTKNLLRGILDDGSMQVCG